MLWGTPTAESEGEKLRVADSAIWKKQHHNRLWLEDRAQACHLHCYLAGWGLTFPGGRLLHSDGVCGHVLRTCKEEE